MSKLDQLRKIAEIVNTDKASSKEVALVLSKLVENFKSAISQVRGEISSKASPSQIESAVKSLRNELFNVIDKSSKNVSNEVYKIINNEVYKIEKLISEIPQYDPSQLEQKFSAVILDLERRLNSIKIPVIEELTGKNIVDKINILPIEEDKQIDVEHIKGIEGFVRKIVNKFRGNSGFVGGGGSGGGKIVKAYDLSSQLDGVTKTFNLPAMWRVISVHASSFPNIMRETVDYTWTPQSITFTSEIDAGTTLTNGQSLIIIYGEA